MRIPEPISNDQLQTSAVPKATARYDTIARFALTFNGYEWDGESGRLQKCVESTRRHFDEKGVLPRRTLDELRALLFFEQRRFRHFGENPKGVDLRYVRELLSAIRQIIERR